MAVSEAYRGKPDHDEPWRWVCPDCQGQVNNGKNERNIARPYQCNQCNKRWNVRELYDKKTDTVGGFYDD